MAGRGRLKTNLNIVDDVDKSLFSLSNVQEDVKDIHSDFLNETASLDSFENGKQAADVDEHGLHIQV